MKKQTLSLLACPECHTSLNLFDAEERNGEIFKGSLKCTSHHIYPIINFIPRFTKADYNKIYNYLHKSPLGGTWIVKEEKYPYERLGLNEKNVKGKILLEIGCGIGTYMRAYSNFKPKLIVGIDMSRGVEVARKNVKYKNAEFIQANTFKLPFKPGAFDIVYSTGVLHHTGNTEKAVKGLPRLIKKTGMLTICIYDVRVNALALKYWRVATTRLPRQIVYIMSLGLTPLSYLFKYIKPLSIFSLIIPVTIMQDSQGIKDFKYIWSNIFDDLTVKYLQQHTYPEVFNWFKTAGLQDIEVLEPAISVKGIK